MSEPLPDITVPDGNSRFNTPAGNGFGLWFAQLRQSINIAMAELLNRALAAIPTKKNGNPDVTFSVVDASGKRSWLEIGPDGGPTPHAAGSMAEALTANIGVVVDEKVADLPVPSTISEGPGLAFVAVDQAGRMSELQLDLSGRFTGPFPDRVVAAASSAAVAAANPVAATPIALWGDSMTAPGSGYGERLTAETGGVPTRNYGIGGQFTEAVSARQGGYPATVTFPDNTLPASGAVTVTTSVIIYSSPSGAGLSSGGVTIAGVHGTLTRDNATGTVTFTRDTPGSAVWVPPTTPIITDEATLNRGQMAVIWSGRNGFKITPPEDIVLRLQKMVEYMTAGRKRFLILEVAPDASEVSVPSPTADRVKLDALNALLLRTFPHQFVPVAQYLRGPALSDLGLSPTAQDNTDIANGVTPTSLRSDGLHLNANGNTAAARLIANTLRAKGWITT
ncbi:hypothetical protein [Arthrobacter sp. D2-10]